MKNQMITQFGRNGFLGAITALPRFYVAQGGRSLAVIALATAQLLASQTSLVAQTAASTGNDVKPAKIEDKGLQKPAWLTELSVGVRESHDDNVYLGGADKEFLPATYKVPDGSVAAVEGHGSFFTTISPKIGVDFAKLLDANSALQTLSLSYAPDIVRYGDASTENYTAHRLGAAVKGNADALSFKLDEGFTYIDGSDLGPTYPGSLLSAYGTGYLRERRKQWQDRTTFTLQYDQEAWFLRPTASLLDYNLLTKQLAGITGYQNYADRYDANGGADLGYKVDKDLAVTLGYRYGHQYQEKYSAEIDSFGQTSSSDYQRLLLGFEGKTFSWLDAKVQAGPDFRQYTDAAPVNDRNPTKFYGEATLAATPSKSDTITFNYRQWQWVSSTGKVPYYDSNFDLGYKRKLTDQLSGNLGARLQSSDYNSGDSYSGTTAKPVVTQNQRNDWFYTFSAGLKYAFTASLSADIAYAANLARNEQDGLPASQLPESKREFNDQIASVGVQYKF